MIEPSPGYSKRQQTPRRAKIRCLADAQHRGPLELFNYRRAPPGPTLRQINSCLHQIDHVVMKLQLAAGGRIMELGDAIFGRRSVREYSTRAVETEIIKSLLDAAVHAPSAVNAQPWTFTVVRDQEVLSRVSQNAKAHMLSAMPASEHSEHFRSLLTDPNFHIFYHAPVLILISVMEQGQWTVEDCALAAENLMLAAHGKGLGTCWIGFAQSYLNTSEGKSALDIPQTCVPVAPIIVGYPQAVPIDVPRKAPVVRWVG
jgi:nitroreductase